MPLYVVSSRLDSVALATGLLTQEPQFFQVLTDEMLEGYIKGYISITPPPDLSANFTNNPPTFKPPQLTTAQRDALTLTPADEGLLIYNLDQHVNNSFDGNQWQIVGAVPTTPYSWNAPSATQMIYVQKDGNDTTGDGSIYRPYASVTYALTQTFDASDTKTYCICIGAGRYIEAPDIFRPNVAFRGNSALATTLECSGPRFIMTNQSFFNGGTAGASDLSFASPVYLNSVDANVTAPFTFGFQTVTFQQDFTGHGRNLGQLFIFDHCICIADITATSCLFRIFYSAAISTLSANTLGGSALDLLIQGCLLNADVTISNNSSNDVALTLAQCSFVGNSSLITNFNGLSSFIITADGSSLPLKSRIQHNFSIPSFDQLTDTFNIGYEPKVPANWTTNPRTAQEALDELAARSGGGGGGGGVTLPITSNDVTFNPDVPENWPVGGSLLTPYVDYLGQKTARLTLDLLLKAPIGANTLYCVEGGDFASLQEAVDASGNGYTIFVGPHGLSWGNVVINSANLSIVGLGNPNTFNVAVESLQWVPNVGNPDAKLTISNLNVKDGLTIGGTNQYKFRAYGCIFDSVSPMAQHSINILNSANDSLAYFDNCLIDHRENSGPAINHTGSFAQFIRCMTSGGDYALDINNPNGFLVYSLGNFSYNVPRDIIIVNAGGLYLTYGSLENDDSGGGSGIYVSAFGNVILAQGLTFFFNNPNGYLVRGEGNLVYTPFITINGACDRFQNTLTIGYNNAAPVVAP